MQKTAIGTYVLIQPEPPEETTPGGIVLPANADNGPVRGTVISAGIEAYVPLKEEQVVLYRGDEAEAIEIDGETYHLVDHEAVLVILGDTGYEDEEGEEYEEENNDW